MDFDCCDVLCLITVFGEHDYFHILDQLDVVITAFLYPHLRQRFVIGTRIGICVHGDANSRLVRPMMNLRHGLHAMCFKHHFGVWVLRRNDIVQHNSATDQNT